MLVLLLSRERSSFQRSCVFPFPHHPQLQLHLAYCSFPWEALPLIFSQLVWVYAKSLQSCLTLCNPMNCSLPGSSVHRILQARILGWVAIPFFQGSSWPKDWTHVSCIAERFFTVWATREAIYETVVCLISVPIGSVLEVLVGFFFFFWYLLDFFLEFIIPSKFGKLSSGHRTGKGQFSFQSQRKAMPENAQTTAQLHPSHTLLKWCLKFSKPGFSNTWTVNFQMFKLVLEKTEEPEIKLTTSARSLKKQESSRKTSISALYAKAFDCVDHKKLKNSERDGNTRPLDLPLEKSVCRSGSNS